MVEQPDTVVADERRAALTAALDRLGDRHRAVVVLRLLEEYSTRETAELLEIPEGTVMSRLTRALQIPLTTDELYSLGRHRDELLQDRHGGPTQRARSRPVVSRQQQ